MASAKCSAVPWPMACLPYDEIWFLGEQIPPIQELAARFGNARSQLIHDNPLSIRDWWIDRDRRARRAARIHE